MIRLCALTMMCLTLSLAHAGDLPEDFAFAQPIEVQSGSGLARIVLPLEVYQGSVVTPLADLRIVDSKGQSVPFGKESRREEVVQGSSIDLTFYPIYASGPVVMDNTTMKLHKRGQDVTVEINDGASPKSQRTLRGYLLDLKALRSPLVRLEFSWQAAQDNELLSVDIDESDDLRNWRRLLDNGTLASLRFNGQSLLRDSVDFPPAKPAYMRVSFAGSGQVLTGVRGRTGSSALAATRQWSEYLGKKTAADTIEFDLGGDIPLERLQLVLTGDNVMLPLEVLARKKDSDAWMTQGAHTFYRIQQGDRTVSSPELALSGLRYRYWKLHATGSTSFAEALRIRGAWTPETLVFVTQGSPPYRLVYGNAGVRDVALPIASVVPGYGSDRAPQIVTATLGAQQVLAGPRAQAKRFDYKKTLLWGAMVAGVMLLAWMAWSLTRQMKK